MRFEMELKNVTEDYDISSSALDVPLTILPSDNVSLSEVTITDFSDEYNIKDTLNLKFTIKDKY
ncbi:MAG: hypothetical protein LBF15_04760 [Candidatus Peribacteria bacterium]|nr:hypothetical protein [Candidatus Peribacteria bacterium]